MSQKRKTAVDGFFLH